MYKSIHIILFSNDLYTLLTHCIYTVYLLNRDIVHDIMLHRNSGCVTS